MSFVFAGLASQSCRIEPLRLILSLNQVCVNLSIVVCIVCDWLVMKLTGLLHVFVYLFGEIGILCKSKTGVCNMSIFQEKWINNGSLEIETESGKFVCEAGKYAVTGSDAALNYIVNMHNHYLDMVQKANIVIGTLEHIAKVTALKSAATIGENGRSVQINHGMVQDSTGLERIANDIASAIQSDGYKIDVFNESDNGNISLGKFDVQNSDGLKRHLNTETPERAE